MKQSPTSRTLNMLRERGLTAQVVEKWLPLPNAKPGMPPGRRIDLFGVIDIVVAAGLGGIQGWQACAAASFAARIDKAVAEPRLKVWLASGGRFYVIGWALRGARGEVKRYKPNIVELRLREGEVVRIDEEALFTMGATG